MDAGLLARIQFGFTAGFHFIFPPLTIGLAWLIFILMTRYLRTGDEQYRTTVKFWLKLFVINFAVGVATGITLEFQFGTNWERYSRFVGDIFGAPLAAEGIFAFFLESVFVGVLIFGWKKLSRRTLWFASLMVAVGSTLSAFWIIVANSWQQTPAGFELVAGRAHLVNFFDAVFNPSTIPRYLHTVLGALLTGAFFMLGTSAWFIRKKRNMEFAKRSMKLALVVAFVVSITQLGSGHYHAIQVAHTQPVKLAAFEGLFETQEGAPMLLFGVPNTDQGRVDFELAIPGLLSFLTFGDSNARMQGLNDFPRDEWPPILSTFFSFHMMVGIGMCFIGISFLGLLLLWRKKLFESKLFMLIAMLSVPLPFVGNILGWMSAEMGRQPWIVQGLLKTKDAFSVVVPAWQVLASLILFVLVYALLAWVWWVLLRNAIRKGPEETDGNLDAESSGDSSSDAQEAAA